MRRLSWALGAVSLAVMAGLGLASPAGAQAPVPDTTTTTAPDPNAVATRAAAAWSAPEPRIRTNPPPTRAQVAGLATWLWVEPPGPLRFSSTDGPTTVALEAQAREVRFELGDGATLTCAGTGTPYDASRPESAQSSACTHAWEATSGGETLQVRATVTWDIFFEGRPVGTEAASSDLDVAVAEAQALDRRPDPMSGAEGDAGANADADSGGRPLGELGELVPEKDKGCGFNPFCWGGKGLNALGDLARGAWDTVWFLGEQLDGIVIGLAKGFGALVGEAFVIARGIVKLAGIYDLVDWVITRDGAFDEFKNTWAGLWDGVKTVFTTNPLTTLKGMVMGVWEPMRDSWKRGDYGEAIGRGAFDALVAVFGAKGLGKASKVKGAKDGTPAAGVTDDAARTAARTKAAAPSVIARQPVNFTATRPLGTKQTYSVFQRTDINWDRIRTSGPARARDLTNREAATRFGLSPELSDGSFATLHHIGQKSTGPLVEASTRYHGVGRSGQDTLHSQFGRNQPHPDLPVDRRAFDIDNREYWRWRASGTE